VLHFFSARRSSCDYSPDSKKFRYAQHPCLTTLSQDFQAVPQHLSLKAIGYFQFAEQIEATTDNNVNKSGAESIDSLKIQVNQSDSQTRTLKRALQPLSTQM
jgi:heterodisulfide reductase subunit B